MPVLVHRKSDFAGAVRYKNLVLVRQKFDFAGAHRKFGTLFLGKLVQSHNFENFV